MENGKVYFTISNFIDDDFNIRIFQINIEGACKKLGGQTSIQEDVKKVSLDSVKFDEGNVNVSIKSDTLDFEIKKGSSSSFWFRYINPKFDCNVRLVVGYTDPLSGKAAFFNQRINVNAATH